MTRFRNMEANWTTTGGFWIYYYEVIVRLRQVGT